jgi:hypothetical protein
MDIIKPGVNIKKKLGADFIKPGVDILKSGTSTYTQRLLIMALWKISMGKRKKELPPQLVE